MQFTWKQLLIIDREIKYLKYLDKYDTKNWDNRDTELRYIFVFLTANILKIMLKYWNMC